MPTPNPADEYPADEAIAFVKLQHLSLDVMIHSTGLGDSIVVRRAMSTLRTVHINRAIERSRVIVLNGSAGLNVKSDETSPRRNSAKKRTNWHNRTHPIKSHDERGTVPVVPSAPRLSHSVVDLDATSRRELKPFVSITTLVPIPNKRRSPEPCWFLAGH
jgi:hypothetical protein